MSRIKYFVLAVAIWCYTQANPIINIDCDCSGTSLESDPSACCVSELPDFNAATSFTFHYLPNASTSSTQQSITQFKMQSSKNFSEIPKQIIDTFQNLVYLDAAIGLRTLPQLPMKLKQLSLGYNQLKTIDANAFDANDLEHINLQYNEINNIADSAFNGLTKLTTLNLYHNKLTILKRSTFNGATMLQNIDLSSNEIATIEDGAFDLPHLKEILISDNKLKHLSDNIFRGAPHLQNIDLQRNQLEHIGRAFDGAQHLHQLQLSENRHLQDLDVLVLSNLPELNSLSIDAIGIRTLSATPTTITSMQSPLHTMSMSQNHLSATDFLKQLSIFSKLEKLFIDANKFTRWDDTDVRNIKKYFPHIELIVTKSNHWDRRWVEMSLIPVFQTNNIFCSNIKYLNTYIEGFTNSVDGQIIEGTECI